MNERTVRWRNISYWKYKLSTTLLISFIAFFVSFHTTTFIAIFMDSVLVLYVGSAISLLGAVLVWIFQIRMRELAPKKVGYDDDNLYYYDARGARIQISFGDIEELTCSQFEGGYLTVVRRDRSVVRLGPGCGNMWGKKILELYCRWVQREHGKHCEVKERGRDWISQIRT